MNKIEAETISFFKRRRTFSVTAIVVLFLAITNPSLKAFKEYIGAYNSSDGTNSTRHFNIIRRDRNYFIFSFYEYEDATTDRGYYYFAIAGNFYQY